MTPPNDFDDLRGFDLSKLELDAIELDIERPPNPLWRWLAGLTLLGLIGAAIVYGERLRAMSEGGWGFGLSLLAIIIGIAFGRWVWSAAMARAAEDAHDQEPPEPEGPPSAGLRWFTFLLGAGGAVTLVVAVRSGTLTAWFGDQAIFVSGTGALFIGVVLSRWLTMQAEAANARDQEEPDDAPIELPPWFKWVSFTVIVGAAIVLFVANLMSAGAFDFSLGGAGFIVGLAAAIWLARRFDDLERKAREARRSPRT